MSAADISLARRGLIGRLDASGTQGESDPFMKWRRVSGVAGATYFSDDGQWTIQAVKSGEYRLRRNQQSVGDFPTLRLAQEAVASPRY
jgi:hypothetical protein